jgi:hypothetical protein
LLFAFDGVDKLIILAENGVTGKLVIVCALKLLHDAQGPQVDRAGIAAISFKTVDGIFVFRVDDDLMRDKVTLHQAFFFLYRVDDDQGFMRRAKFTVVSP